MDFEFRTVKKMMTMWWMPELVKLNGKKFSALLFGFMCKDLCVTSILRLVVRLQSSLLRSRWPCNSLLKGHTPEVVNRLQMMKNGRRMSNEDWNNA